ncbi:MAG TPA: FAD-dependent oxidoreductase, partial [Clostridia bacterium]|nr:FAD-dependent oxidoreductase [Clostridia bacterium]
KDAQKIVVIGGGIVGAETAYMLRYEMNKDVKVVEMQKYFMNHACTANRGHIIRYLEKGGVELINCAMLKKIEGNKVYIAKNVHKRVPDPYNTWAPILPENVENPMDLLKPFGEVIEERILEADKVLLAMGVSPKSALYTELVSEHAAPEIYNVGDSFRGARIFEAVRGAYRKAVSI